MLLLRQFLSELANILTQCSPVWIVYSGSRPYDVNNDVMKSAILKLSNADISRMGHPMDFEVDSCVGYRRRRIEWNYFQLHQIQDSDRLVFYTFSVLSM